MSIKGGPRVVISKAPIILSYDGISAKSYAGESTTNLASANRNSAYTWTNSGAWSLTYHSYGNSPVGHPPINPDEYGNVSVLKGSTTTTGSQHFGIAHTSSLSSSTVYTYSVWYYQLHRSGIGGPYCRSNQSNTNLGNLRYKGQTGTSNWPKNKWIRLEREFTTQSSDTQVYISNYIGNTVGDTMFFAAPQLEQKSYATPFTSSSRTGSWTDLSGLGNSGTFTNMTGTAKLHRRKGSVMLNNNFLNFDGSNDYVSTSFGSGRNPSTEPITYSFWVRKNNTDNEMFAVQGHWGSAGRAYFGVLGGYFNMGIHDDGWADNVSTRGPSCSTGKWYNVVVVFTGSNARMYVDGIYYWQRSYTSYTFNQSLQIGSHAQHEAHNYAWTGSIAKVTVYDGALTDSDVKNEFKSLRRRFER